jgi:peptidoglycan/LPS O-acetylase OafA/YrhL
LPALLLVASISIPFAWVWLIPDQMKEFAQSLVALNAFASNILFLRQSGYFDEASELKPLLHTWSLAVEQQYYLVFPVLLTLAWRWKKECIPWLFGVLAVLSLYWAHWSALTYPVAAFYLLPSRGWELLIGSLVAHYLSTRSDHLRRGGIGKEIAAAVGLALLTCSVFGFDANNSTPYFALVPTLSTALIILFAEEGTLVARVLSMKFCVGLGLISYSAYLWHQPLFSFYRHSGREQSTVSSMALIVVVAILSFFTWKYVEKPFRKSDLFTRRQVFSFLTVIMFSLTLTGIIGHETQGFKDRSGMSAFSDLIYKSSLLGFTECNNFLVNDAPTAPA